MPKSLGETLSAPIPASLFSSSVPINGDIPRSNGSTTPKPQQNSMAPQEEKPHAGITFAAQDKLPKLPIPELASSCTKYLAALKPLQSPREQSETRRAVDEFLRHEGPELQEKLKKYAEGRTSYIEQFCE